MQEHSMPQANSKLRDERLRRQWTQQDLADHLQTTKLTIGRWERGISVPSAHFRLKLCALFGRSVEELGLVPACLPPLDITEVVVSEEPLLTSPSQANSLWNVPFLRNPYFTGRDHVLEHLHRVLTHGSGAAALTQSYALSGLGGIGKTQLAVEYAYQYRRTYETVLWVQAETQTSLVSSFMILAGLLSLPEKTEQEQGQIVAAVVRWLNQHKGWLLIFDNVEELSLLKPFLPVSDQGALLFTTRLQTLGTLAQQIELSPMTEQEGSAFLLLRISQHRWNDVPALPDPQEVTAAQAITAEMGGLPLALEQTGAYIEATQCSLSDYLHLFQRAPDRFLDEHEASSDHPLSVSRTFALAFEQVQQRNPLAATLLTICAFLAPEAIPETIFLQGDWSPDVATEGLPTHSWAFHEALKVLLCYSLLQRQATTRTITIHRLVQTVVRGRIRKLEQEQWQLHGIMLLGAAFPAVTYPNWPQCERLLPHVLRCAGDLPTSINNLALAGVLQKAATYLYERGHYEQAESLSQRVLCIYEQMLEPDHPNVAEALNQLAFLYKDQGKYAQAQPLYERALHIREHVFGSNHPQLVSPLMGLAFLSLEQSLYTQAEAFLRHALSIWEQSNAFLPHDSAFLLSMASPLEGLANLYHAQGNYGEAKSLYQQVISIRERALGPDHPQVAHPLSRLAQLHHWQGNYEQAEFLYQRVIAIRKQALGSSHPVMITSLTGLAFLYNEQGRYREAEPLLQQTLQRQKQAVGLQHPDLVYSLIGLARLNQWQGKDKEAEHFYERAIHLLDPHDPQLAYPFNDLASLYQAQGRSTEAKRLYEQAIQIWEHVLGTDHPQIAYALNGLANLHREQGQYEQAEPLYQHVLSIWEQTLGPEHPALATALNGLANLHREQHHYEQAAPLYQRALALRQQHLCPEHPDIAENLYDLACLHNLQFHSAEALACYQQALAIREQVLGIHHPKTAEIRERLHAISNTLGRTEETTTLNARQPKRDE